MLPLTNIEKSTAAESHRPQGQTRISGSDALGPITRYGDSRQRYLVQALRISCVLPVILPVTSILLNKINNITLQPKPAMLNMNRAIFSNPALRQRGNAKKCGTNLRTHTKQTLSLPKKTLKHPQNHPKNDPQNDP